MKESIYAALRGVLGKRELPELGTIVDDIYTVILCPVCHHKTLDNHDICRHCGWQHDGFPEDHYSAANGATLAEYREQYKQALKERNMQDVSIL